MAINIGHDVEKMVRDDSRLHNICMMCECNGERGVPKTNENTQMMVTLVKNRLENGKIAFSEALKTTTEGKNPEQMKEKLLNQLENFTLRVKEAANDFVEPTRKMNGKIGGANDDVAVAFIMCEYWYGKFWGCEKESYNIVKQYSAAYMQRYISTIRMTNSELYKNITNESTKKNQKQYSNLLLQNISQINTFYNPLRVKEEQSKFSKFIK